MEMKEHRKNCFTQVRLTGENDRHAHTSYISPERMDYSSINSQRF